MVAFQEAGVAKGFMAGTHRLVPPAETLERVRPHLAAMGITRIANVTGLDRIGIPVVMVCRPNSRSLSVSQGKGLTLDAAKASGVMESIELYHAEHIHLPLTLGSVAELEGRRSLVDVERLPGIIRGRYGRTLQMLWIEGEDLMTGERALLPFEVVHASARTPAPSGSGCFSSTSNGLASGNHRIEAVLHGICEVVERDATALWEARSLERKKATRIDLRTVDDPACRQVLHILEEKGIDAAVWETTSDIGIPAFICQIDDRRRDLIRGVTAFCGMGCHTSRGVALLRALTEAVQCRLTLIAGSRDDLFRKEYKNKIRGESIGGPYDALLGEDRGGRRFSDVPTHESGSFDDDLTWTLGRLAAAGLSSVMAVDLTREELGIPVTRIVIPGLEGPDDEPEYMPGARALAVRRETMIDGGQP